MTLNTFAVKVSNQMVFKDTVKHYSYFSDISRDIHNLTEQFLSFYYQIFSIRQSKYFTCIFQFFV